MKLNIFYKKQIKSNLYSDKSIFNINLKMILSMNIKKKNFLYYMYYVILMILLKQENAQNNTISC